VFTARYALSPYIKQTRFVFKGLKACVHVEEFRPLQSVASSGHPQNETWAESHATVAFYLVHLHVKVSMAAKIYVMVFWVVTLFSFVT
jgi:hypothetical protein